MRKKLDSVIRQGGAAVIAVQLRGTGPGAKAASRFRERHAYTTRATPARFWSVREVPPEIPYEVRPGRTLKPRRKRRIHVARPGEKGTKRLMAQYGDRFVCVRYIYDAATGKRTKTVELLLEEAPWTAGKARIAPDQLVGLHIDFHERAMREAVKAAGARWDRLLQVWVLPYRDAVELRLAERITHTAGTHATGTHAANAHARSKKEHEIPPQVYNRRGDHGHD